MLYASLDQQNHSFFVILSILMDYQVKGALRTKSTHSVTTFCQCPSNSASSALTYFVMAQPSGQFVRHEATH